MRAFLIITTICVVVASAYADSDVLQYANKESNLVYDMRTGEITQVASETRRFGRMLWATEEDSDGRWSSTTMGSCRLDWADIEGGVTVGAFGFDAYTNSQADDGDNTVVIVFYANDDGWGDTRKQIVVGYTIDNMSGSTHPANEYWGGNWRVIPNTPFVLDGDDLDGDTLVDFSYAMWYQTLGTPNARMGCSLSEIDDPNVIPPSCPGVDNAFDYYLNPDFDNDPNLHDCYVESRWFGGDPFAQFFFEIYAPSCPNPGAHFKYCAGDIANANCIVDLADLAQLLGHYGTGDSFSEGDIEPPDDFFPGDGDVDLADLAEMLGQYGDDCNV